jgi:hypothetical protein
MQKYTFPAWCRYGKVDSGESWIDVELTDEEAERLIKYGTQAEIYYEGFFECEELEDIYKKVYALAVEQMTEEIREYGDDDHTDDPEWVVDDTYACGVNFPSEFEDLLIEEDEDEKVF